MRGALLALAAVSLTAGARAESLTTDLSPCGGNAYSSAQVIERGRPRRGPVTAMPDTLCADLAPQHPAAPVEIYVSPHGGRGIGLRGGGAPYGGEPQRGDGPPEPRPRRGP